MLVAFVGGMVMSGLGSIEQMWGRSLGAGIGVLVALGLVKLWAGRTLPKNRISWWLMGGALLVWLILAGLGVLPEELVGPYALGPLALFVFFFVFHDHHLAPSMLLGALVLAVLIQPGLEWAQAGEPEAAWIAFATLAGVFAAVLKREQMARRYAVATPGLWMVFRLFFVGAWTIIIMSLREEVQWARLFAWLGLDAGSPGGQVALVALILVSLVVAAFALKPRRSPTDPSGRSP